MGASERDAEFEPRSREVSVSVAAGRAGTAAAFLLACWVFRRWSGPGTLPGGHVLIATSWVVMAAVIAVAVQWGTKRQWSWTSSLAGVVVALVAVVAACVFILDLRLVQ